MKRTEQEKQTRLLKIIAAPVRAELAIVKGALWFFGITLVVCILAAICTPGIVFGRRSADVKMPAILHHNKVRVTPSAKR